MISIEELSVGWGLKSLKEIVTKIQTGTTPPSKIESYYNGNIQWFRPEDIGQEKYLNVSSRTITEEAVKHKKARIFDPNTLMITCIGNIGRVGILSNTASSNQQITGIKVNEEICKTDYLYWWFQFIRPRIHEVSPGGIIKILNQNNLLSIPIPLPYPDDPARSLAEQRRIVARLEALLGEVKALREQVQTLQRDLNRLMESALAEVFPAAGQPLPEGWGWVKVSKIANDTTRRNPQSESDKPFRYVDIAAVDNQEFRIDSEKVKVLQGKDAPSRARKVIRAGNIIFATTRPYLKKIALVTAEFDNQICSTGFCVLCPDSENIHSRYLYHAVKANSFINQLIPKQRGANYPAVTDSDVFDCEIPIPFLDNPPYSLAEQRRIVAYLDAIQQTVREAQELIQADLRAIEQLEQSILAAAFRGEL